MSRIAGASLNEAQSQVVRPAWLVSMALANGTGTYDLAAADSDVTWGGKTYKHTTFNVQPMDEREDGTVISQQVVFSLGEQDLASVTNVQSNYVWKKLDITLVLIDDTGTPLTDSIYAWTGYMTSRAIDQNEGSGTLAIVGQDWMSLLHQTGRIRFDDTSQQARNAGDTFFANMPGLQGQHVVWMGRGNNILPPDGGTRKKRTNFPNLVRRK